MRGWGPRGATGSPERSGTGLPQVGGESGGTRGLGGLILKEAGREGSSGFSAVWFSLSWVVTGFSPRQEESRRGEEKHAPPTLLPASLGTLLGRG